MLAVRCAAEGREVLLSVRRIRSIHLGADVVEIGYTCWCGHQGTVRDPRPGRPATPEATAAA